MKKLIALLLAALMIFGVLAGCASETAPSGDTAADSSDTADTTTDTTTENTPTTTEDGIPVITWYQVGGGQPKDIEAWNEIVNPYLEEKIGVHLNMQVVDWGSWGDRRTMLVQTNEDYDIIFTDMSTYVNNISMGAFADLTELIKDTPGITDLIPEEYLKACNINGKLYGIPAYKDSSMTNFFVWTKDYVDQYYPDYAEDHDLFSIDEGLRAIYEGTGETPMMLNKDGISCIIGNRYDNFGSGLPAIGVSYYSDDAKVVSVFEQDDVLDQLRQMHTWYNDGLINSDANTLDNFQGMCAVGVAQGWPSASVGWGQGRGAEVVVSQFGDSVVSNDTVQGSISCINASSPNIDKALALLELVNTDTKVRDWFAYGVEGVNFEYVEEDGMQKIKKLNQDWSAASYTQGSNMRMTPESGTVGNPYLDEVAVQNANALSSPALGFYFDTTNVADQLAACTATWLTYKSLLVTGAGDPDTVVPEMLDALRADGLDEIIAEAQTQLDAYVASNGAAADTGAADAEAATDAEAAADTAADATNAG